MLMPTTFPAAIPGAANMHQALEAQGLSQKDTTFTKIFVGGLPYHTTDKSLREHFEVYGDIDEAVVITDRQSGKSRGYGFVTMADKGGAERAIKEPNPVIDGRKANVNLAYLGAKPRGSTAGISLPGVRYSPSVLQSHYGLPANYVYSPYLPTAAGLLPVTHTQLSQAALATAANQHPFYDYGGAAASYPAAAYQTAAGMEPYAAAASVAASAASAISQYSAGVPGYSWSLPPAATAAAAAAAAGTIPINPYQTAQPQLQEARMQ